jgi:hypothetical protein
MSRAKALICSPGVEGEHDTRQPSVGGVRLTVPPPRRDRQGDVPSAVMRWLDRHLVLDDVPASPALPASPAVGKLPHEPGQVSRTTGQVAVDRRGRLRAQAVVVHFDVQVRYVAVPTWQPAPGSVGPPLAPALSRSEALFRGALASRLLCCGTLAPGLCRSRYRQTLLVMAIGTLPLEPDLLPGCEADPPPLRRRAPG